MSQPNQGLGNKALPNPKGGASEDLVLQRYDMMTLADFSLEKHSANRRVFRIRCKSSLLKRSAEVKLFSALAQQRLGDDSKVASQNGGSSQRRVSQTLAASNFSDFFRGPTNDDAKSAIFFHSIPQAFCE